LRQHGRLIAAALPAYIAALQAVFIAVTSPSYRGIIADFIAAWLPTCTAALQAVRCGMIADL
jgi:hypothetical protein